MVSADKGMVVVVVCPNGMVLCLLNSSHTFVMHNM